MPRRRREGRWGRPSGVRRALVRMLALMAAAGAAGLAVWGLRSAGLEFRWERGASSGPASSAATPPPAASRREPRVTEVDPRGALLPGRDAAGAAPGPVDGAGAMAMDESAPGGGSAVRIQFDRYADGSAACAPCPVSDEWRARGLRVSFRSWTAASERPMVLDGGQYLPPGRPPRVLGPPLDPDRGLEVGVIRLDFPGRPRTVSLSLFGPDLIPAFEVTARRGSTRLPESAVGRVVRGRYDPAGLGLFREERITVRWSDGIDRISVDGWGPPGHLLLVGTIEIDP